MEIPKDLKMSNAAFPSASDIARELLEQTQSLRPQTSTASGNVIERIPDAFAKAVITIVTNVWRIRSKISDSAGEGKEAITKDDIKKVNRYLEMILESLSGIEVDIKDRTGEAFDYGLPEKVVATQPQPGIGKEHILETLRPTIYWCGQIVQQGEVVIATPEETTKREERK